MLSDLWRRYPALFVGISLLSGVALALDRKWAFCIPLLSLFSAFFSYRKVLCMLLVAALTGYAMTKLRYIPPDESENDWKGEGVFVISSFQKSASPFQEFWRYGGILQTFEGKTPSQRVFCKNIPCSLFLSLKMSPPPAHCAYAVEGTLQRKGRSFFSFKAQGNWRPEKGTFSLAKARFEAKEKIRRVLRECIPHPKSYAFLSALATGEIEDRALSFEFGRLGLVHLLAISGFHFGWIAALLTLLIGALFPPRMTTFLLLPLITLYFFFIGEAPSCQRAWIAISCFLTGRLFVWRASGLNILGVGLIIALLLDPLVILKLGFQLSFLLTLAILLFTSPCEALISSLLPPRKLSALQGMKRIHQAGYLMSATLRKTLALNTSVHLFAIPATLSIFGKFPFLSLLYNLFIPSWVGISLVLLILGLLLTPISPLFSLFHLANSSFTAALLRLISHPPLSLHFFLKAPQLPLWAVIFFFTLLFWTGLLATARSKLTESLF